MGSFCCNCRDDNTRCCCPEHNYPPLLHATLIPVDVSACCNIGVVTIPLVRQAIGNPDPANCTEAAFGWFGQYVSPNNCSMGGAACTNPDACGQAAAAGPCTFGVLFQPAGCCFRVRTTFQGNCCAAAGPGNCIIFETTAVNAPALNTFSGGDGFVPGYTCAGGSQDDPGKCNDPVAGGAESCLDATAPALSACDCLKMLPLEYFTVNWQLGPTLPLSHCAVRWARGYTPGVGADDSLGSTYKCITRLIVSK